MARSSTWVGALALALPGCGVFGGGGEPEPIVTEWTVSGAEHVALWYHGLATARAAAQAAGVVEEAAVLPNYRPGYSLAMTEAKRAAGVYPTALDRRAEEFGRTFAGDPAYDALQFLPLYFFDTAALSTALQIWVATGGEAGAGPGPQSRGVVAVLSAMFPEERHRRVIGEWVEVLEEEARVFYRAYWERRFLEVERLAANVKRNWDGLADTLVAYLDSVNLEGGDIFLTPALDIEGRLVGRGAGVPRVAVMTPDSTAPGQAVLALVHEIAYPLVAQVLEQSVTPERLSELGERRLSTRAAVRVGAMLLELRAPSRVEAYQRFYLERSGREPPESGLAQAFEAAFPLPADLVEPLRQGVERASQG